MENLNNYIEYLGIKLPVTIKVKTRVSKKYDAYYLPKYNNKGKLAEHMITVYIMGLSRSLDTIIAHELIHAKQEETKTADIHGAYFQSYARTMEKHFGLEQIFVEGLDV